MHHRLPVSSTPDRRDRAGPAQPLLIARDLRKYFPVKGARGKSVQAVDGVSFTVGKGETLGIVGESGCGKSTLARLLLHLLVPDAGELVFDGEAVGTSGGIAVNALRRQVQMVFQDSYSSLNPRMPIRDSVAFGPFVQGKKKHEARGIARDILGKVGLDPDLFGPRYPHELSGGQKQRVNIARALATGPRMVILDEPVSALDKSVEAQVLNLLRALKRQFNLTFVFISHDLNVVRYISQRVLVMYLGRVVELGPADAIFERPQHPYTRALLASRPSMDPARRIEEPPSGSNLYWSTVGGQAGLNENTPAPAPLGAMFSAYVGFGVSFGACVVTTYCGGFDTEGEGPQAIFTSTSNSDLIQVLATGGKGPSNAWANNARMPPGTSR